jgi:hypothetical protein
MFTLRCRQAYLVASVSSPGVADISGKLSPVLLLPAINYRCHNGIDENPEQGIITGSNDTGDKRKVVNISAYFRKKIRLTPIGYSGARGKLVCEKNLKSKISCQAPFNLANMQLE